MNKRFQKAPSFYCLYTLLIALGGGFVLTGPTMAAHEADHRIASANGILLPFVLFFMLTLVNPSV